MFANPPIEEVIEIPQRLIGNKNSKNELIKEISSGTIPYFDKKPFAVHPNNM